MQGGFQPAIPDVAQPVTGDDRKIDEVRGTQRTRIDGDNVRAYWQRMQRTRGGDG